MRDDYKTKRVSFKVYTDTGDTFDVSIWVDPDYDEEEQVEEWMHEHLEAPYSYSEWEWC